jgi:SAM-dependent methyltransferase
VKNAGSSPGPDGHITRRLGQLGYLFAGIGTTAAAKREGIAHRANLSQTQPCRRVQIDNLCLRKREVPILENTVQPPVGWPQLKKHFIDLRNANEAGHSLADFWASFVSAALASEAAPPVHLQLILSILQEAGRAQPRDELVILDHGCGGGFTLLYLFALGYRSIHGVDPSSPCEDWNRLLASECGIAEQRFWIYDGLSVPLGDNSVDVIFSQQVLEHVQPHLPESYYAEEGRVLKEGGIAYHQVPHRLVPYDSHSRTWLIHFLPLRMRRPLYRRTSNDPNYIESILWLRWPWIHRSGMIRHVGNYEDRTIERLAGITNLEDYERKNRGLRRFIGILVRLPFFGALMAPILRNLVMLDTVSIKPTGPG